MLRLGFVLLLASCYAPDLADCAVACAADGDCGGDQVCTAPGMCAREGITCGAASGIDAVASIDPDAGVHDAALDPDASDDAPPDAPPPPPDAPPETTTLRVKIKDKGRVTPTAMTPCLMDCTYQVPSGQAITLTAVPAEHRIFEKWEEGCPGQPLPVCVVTPAGPETRVTAKFKKVD